MRQGIFVPAAVLFPERERTFSAFRAVLARLSRTDVLFWCARLNHVLSGTIELSHERQQSFGLRHFCTQIQLDLLDTYCRLQHRDTRDVSIFFRGQLLELIRWAALFCDDHPNDGTTFEDATVRSDFFYACLLSGKYWERRVYGNALDFSYGIPAARWDAVGPLRLAADGSAVAGEWGQHLGRGYRLFTQYLPQVDSGFLSAFQQATRLSVEEYLTCWAAVLTSYAKRNTETTIFNAAAAADPTANREVFQRFIKIEAQSADELRNNLWPDTARDDPHVDPMCSYSLKPLRERPVLRARDERSILLDPVLALDKCSIGPLFHALRTADPNALFASFGRAFESYAADAFSRMFPTSVGLVSPLSCNVMGSGYDGTKYEIDVALNFVTDLVLIETKAVWPREAELSPNSAELFVERMRKQFGSTRESVKGAGQLARIINAIAAQIWRGPADVFADARTIYPVLLVHDRGAGAAGFSTFIANEFRRALAPHDVTSIGEFQVSGLRILPPIVLTVEDLELLEVSSEHQGFLEFLRLYHEWSPDRTEPFGDCLAEQSRGGKIYANRHLAGAALELLDRTVRRFFPDAIEPKGSG